MQSLHDIPAPAKLNLFLHITGRRADGYHLLQSVFMLIDWCDTLHLDLRTDGQLSREDLSTPLPADDLCLRAARLLQQHTGCRLGAHIGIEKRIPAQAGMGGGSSDAASVLLGLNRLWQLDLSREQLCQLGVQLGADVPFFLGGHNAWVEGIGEQLTPITLPPVQAVVVKPAAGLDTKLIFSDPFLSRNTKPAIVADFADNASSIEAIRFGRNDLQAVAERLCPDVSTALKWLASKGLAGRMTGSGSAVFALSPTPVDVKDAPPDWQVRCCSGLGVHPLLDWATSDSLSVGSKQ